MNVDRRHTTQLDPPEWGVFRQDRPATVGYVVSLTRDRSAAELIARDIVREGRGAVVARVVHLGVGVPTDNPLQYGANHVHPEYCSTLFSG